ncbi:MULTISPECIES: bifunctional phosphoribosylaminoimidazolecarboxamide formyltransferase/IMP cyclohydrolase [unclassified Actinomyces]|uniref:bifunctional phosphoribosylaminoimidazolecarboxamide formyltransferase/IMP cyclohydrolase n=1 Tax=unclassified Actinomyces TaxID=2609248 RepID=UPI0020170F9D|nr:MULTISPECIES: bifunctional phosphoribosylaminoimidazolecarboxamide formyltransferase/IMP cyclohydrolase [unclassified Actinomyces]MCL3778097.1 bifunctional phosphoribosylaminoimidazolecarboxamide formyltransferase/IMP cyclohydrolase [Actinomyces sp. AC-20-1]MCL3788728.1 bifunctional phosphoribosylaminoimidazolecarboxamide formyltransferase/IMP cyclohydrolase [Actinomyces sp. 187325]MCL3794358.1 bifunctional phosphoribosylaminoimidazolecarboxamide formyltransferase/IMP cyclohydrolase [Actinomy
MSTPVPTTHVPTEGLIDPEQVPVRRALVSVYDKTGLVELATALAGAGVEILSTGSTAATIAAAGLSVTPVEDVTGFPECLEGRVKTLHPRIHAGILADRRKSEHMAQLDELGVAPIDLVVVNLYPFTGTVASGAPFNACVEQIDIGGPSMVRAAAKNHPAVAVVTDPADYPAVAAAVASGGFQLAERRRLAARAYAHTAAYDAAVATWFAQQVEAGEPQAAPVPPAYVGLGLERLETLRYGENPHQAAAVYTQPGTTGGVARATQLHGKAMSFNNYTDTDAALRAAYDHGDDVTVAVIKHANPCGIAVSASGDVAEAHRKAHGCDPVSAYGGVIATNATVTAEMARQVAPVFTEVVAAPAFEDEAVAILSAKRNLRLLLVEPPAREGYEIKPVSGGAVVQQRDTYQTHDDDPSTWRLVSGEPADETTLADLRFAWRAVRAVRSNAVLLARDGATVGVGMGQVNRVDSCRLAVERANTLGLRSTGDAAADAGPQKETGAVGGADASEVLTADAPERARGAVAASDAFFPFADGLQVLIDAGVRAVVQPGGSIRDEEVIAAAQAAGVTMYLTGSRHFAH